MDYLGTDAAFWVLVTSYAWKNMGYTVILWLAGLFRISAGAYPHKSIYLLPHLFNNWFVNLKLDKMAAAAVCTGGFLTIVVLILQRLWDKDEA